MIQFIHSLAGRSLTSRQSVPVAMIWAAAVLALAATACSQLPTDQNHWRHLAEKELEEALRVKWNSGIAQNVVLFVGDGMGPNTVTATRIYRGGESHRLAFEKFPHMGLLKTYTANKMVPDSAASGTALFCGAKVNQETIGVDATVNKKDCQASLKDGARLKSLAAVALEAGKSAGLVTTMRVTHATPGPLYAHSAYRKWECESNMPEDARECKDIARQLVEDWPGKDLHVVMGGGRQVLVSNMTGTPENPIDTWSCLRKDGRNLIEEYKKDKTNRNLKHDVVINNRELDNIDFEETDYLLGVFANGHLKYEHERDKGPDGMPSLSDMVAAAIKVLRKNKEGYFLMVEGGNIDMGHHRGRAKTAINEASAMEDAVQLALNMTDEHDTLFIVTSDHTHTLSINGYPYRGSSIFGISEKSPVDNLNYTVLSYGTGGPGSLKYSVGENNTVVRKNPDEEDIQSFYYEQAATFTTAENTHGGGDVAIYARGPYAHLFHNVHEQHYVYSVVTYAAKMGAYSSASVLGTSVMCLVLLVFLALL